MGHAMIRTMSLKAGNTLRPQWWLPLLTLTATLAAADLPSGWLDMGGDWTQTREIIPMMRQGAPSGRSVALCPVAQTRRAWRVTVEPALGTAEAGMSVVDGLGAGMVLVMGGTPGVGGLTLKSHDGAVLWQDRYCPWRCYQAYVLECVLEDARVRAQMFEGDGKTLVSQSPWLDLSVPAGSGLLGIFTRDGIARFWGVDGAAEPLSPVVEDAPNKRRLIRDESSPWLVVGAGSWMWTTSKRERLRQGAVVERTSALSTVPRGSEGTWETRIKLDPGAGGAGLLFLTSPELNQGFIAWLGGTFGAGSLMLYRVPLDALWSGAQDNWHYDTEYVVRGETLDGKVRAQLLQADGVTLIQETPWYPMTEEEKGRDGLVGFQTWLGTAEVWGFDDTGGPTILSGLQGLTLNPAISGIMGRWRCRVTPADATTTAGLAFQASRDQKDGFAALLTPSGFVLETLAGQVKWTDAKLEWTPGTEYLVEGEVMTDRVAIRLFAADGKLLSECPAVYVPDTNNRREGCIGTFLRGGKAEFAGLELSR